jgi:hypothetical protein
MGSGDNQDDDKGKNDESDENHNDKGDKGNKGGGDKDNKDGNNDFATAPPPSPLLCPRCITASPPPS